MKKTLLIFVVLFASCFEVQVKPREVNAQSVTVGFQVYKYSETKIHGMVYGLWVSDGNSSAASAIHVVNLTKDALEVELLKIQLERL